jgi:hypothetical protein
LDVFDGAAWLSLPIADEFFSDALHCASPQLCVTYADSIYLFRPANDFTDLGFHYDELQHVSRAVILTEDNIYALAYEELYGDTDGEYGGKLYRFAAGQWLLDPRGPYATSSGLLERIDQKTLAFAYEDSPNKTVILPADGGDPIDPGWPFFTGLVFAGNGVGFAVDSFNGAIYRINGLELTLLLEYDRDEMLFSGFLVAGSDS